MVDDLMKISGFPVEALPFLKKVEAMKSQLLQDMGNGEHIESCEDFQAFSTHWGFGHQIV